MAWRSGFLKEEQRRMQRWIGWFVIAVCGVAYAQEASDDANQRILRALRTFNKAQVLYEIYGKGFACRLEQLGPPQNGAKPSPQAAGLIDEELASGRFAGYQIQLNCTPDDYQVIALPASDGAGAVWCVDKSALLRTAETAGTCIAEGKVPPRPKRAMPDQFSKTAPSVAQETQARGYWIDPSDGLMWAAKDSGKRGSWHNAMKYCRKLRLAGYSDWRLATIDQLESLVNLPAYATEYVGSSDILHRNGDLQVSGGLELTYGRQWSSTPVIEANGHPSGAGFWSFWFDEGRKWKGFEDWAEGDTMNALCVRDASPPPSK
jgi:hypothetical protein